MIADGIRAPQAAALLEAGARHLDEDVEDMEVGSKRIEVVALFSTARPCIEGDCSQFI